MDLTLQSIIIEIPYIEHRRTQFNLSKQDVADTLGISRPTYYRKIEGLSEFTISELVILGKLYGDNYKDYLDNKGNLLKGTVNLN